MREIGETKNDLKLMLRRYAYEYREQGFTLSSGKFSNHYLDARAVTLEPDGHRLLFNLIMATVVIRGCEANAVAGVVLGGVPLAHAAACALDVPVLYVRPEVKEHGKQNQIEGPVILGGKKVLLFEDVVTTGKSVWKAVSVLRQADYEVSGVVALVDREEGGASVLHEACVPFLPLYTLAEIIQTQP